jgi:hypothetical protein
MLAAAESGLVKKRKNKRRTLDGKYNNCDGCGRDEKEDRR